MTLRSRLRRTGSRSAGVPPVLTSISPDVGDIYAGAPITLTGTSMSGITDITFGGTPASSVVVVNATTATCKAPAKAAGTYDVIASASGSPSNTLSAAYEAWSPITDYAAARVFQSDQGTTSATAKAWARTGLVGASLLTIAIDGAEMLTLSSGRLILVAGWHPDAWFGLGGDDDVTNGILYSDDDGATWAELQTRNASAPTSGAGARFLPGHSMPTLLHDVGGVSYVYVIGSDANAVTRDGGVWRCLASGLESGGTPSWERISTTAPTADTSLCAAASFNGAIYVMGGQTTLSDKTTVKKTVWKSADDGETWTQLTDGPWAARSSTQLVVFGGALLLISGGKYATLGADREYFNDVWSMSTSEAWTELLADGHAQFTGRQYHKVTVMGGKLWMINGYDLATGNLKEAVFSSDGITWTQAPLLGLTWFATHAMGCAVASDGETLLMNQGVTNESIYRLREASGTLASAWADRGSGALTLSQATAASQPLLATGVMGDQPGMMFSGAQTMSLPTYDRDIAGGVYEVWLVMRSTNISADGNLVQPTSTIVGCVGAEAYNQFGLNGATMAYYDASIAPNDIRRGSGLTDDVIRLVGVEHQLSSIKFYAGTAQQGATDATVGFNTTYTGWDGLGSSIGGGNYADVTLGAVVVLKLGAVSSATFRTKLNKWAKKWGSVT